MLLSPVGIADDLGYSLLFVSTIIFLQSDLIVSLPLDMGINKFNRL